MISEKVEISLFHPETLKQKKVSKRRDGKAKKKQTALQSQNLIWMPASNIWTPAIPTTTTVLLPPGKQKKSANKTFHNAEASSIVDYSGSSIPVLVTKHKKWKSGEKAAEINEDITLKRGNILQSKQKRCRPILPRPMPSISLQAAANIEKSFTAQKPVGSGYFERYLRPLKVLHELFI